MLLRGAEWQICPKIKKRQQKWDGKNKEGSGRKNEERVREKKKKGRSRKERKREKKKKKKG